MKPRVVLGFDSLRTGNGGIAKVARLIAMVFGESGYDCRAVLLSDSKLEPGFSLPCSCARGSRLRFLCSILLQSLSATHAAYDFVGLARAHPRILGRSRPYLGFIHGIEVWRGTGQEKYVRAAHRANLLLSNSNFTKMKAENDFGGFRNTRVCWLATESDEAIYAPASAHPPTVLILGRIDEAAYKGHAELLQAWPNVRSAIPEARLIIVGGGVGLESVRSAASLVPGVDVAGFVPDSMLEHRWGAADVFAMPSRGEGFGLVYVEAMRRGIPVIASIHDAAQEVNLHGQTGFNVDLDRPDSLATHIIQLLRDKELASRFGRQGREHWQQNFTYSAFKSRLRPIVDSWLGAAAGGVTADPGP